MVHWYNRLKGYCGSVAVCYRLRLPVFLDPVPVEVLASRCYGSVYAQISQSRRESSGNWYNFLIKASLSGALWGLK
jgi:hypothetical protein